MFLYRRNALLLHLVFIFMKIVLGLLALSCVGLAHGQYLPQGGVMGGLGRDSQGAGTSNVRFSTVALGADGGGNAPAFVVMDSLAAWTRYWNASHRGEKAPSLETGFFVNWRLLAIHLGTRPSGGYGVRVASITRIIEQPTIATVAALETVPPRGAGVSQGQTSPWVLVRVEQGAFGLKLRSQAADGFTQGVTTVPGATVIKSGGATIIIGGGGVPSGCDHCDHQGRGSCHCANGARGCDCKGKK